METDMATAARHHDRDAGQRIPWDRLRQAGRHRHPRIVGALQDEHRHGNLLQPPINAGSPVIFVSAAIARHRRGDQLVEFRDASRGLRGRERVFADVRRTAGELFQRAQHMTAIGKVAKAAEPP